jgi:hypothetical protein
MACAPRAGLEAAGRVAYGICRFVGVHARPHFPRARAQGEGADDNAAWRKLSAGRRTRAPAWPGTSVGMPAQPGRLS